VSATTTTGSPDTVVSSSSGPTDLFVDCGDGGACAVDDANVCCWDSNSKQGECSTPDECSLTTAQAFLTAVSCQLPSDCDPGLTCCAHRYFQSDQQPYETTTCSQGCQNPDRQVCDPNAPNICPNFVDQMGQQHQMVCKPSTLLPPGYYICGIPN